MPEPFSLSNDFEMAFVKTEPIDEDSWAELWKHIQDEQGINLTDAFGETNVSLDPIGFEEADDTVRDRGMRVQDLDLQGTYVDQGGQIFQTSAEGEDKSEQESKNLGEVKALYGSIFP